VCRTILRIELSRIFNKLKLYKFLKYCKTLINCAPGQRFCPWTVSPLEPLPIDSGPLLLNAAVEIRLTSEGRKGRERKGMGCGKRSGGSGQEG